VGLGTGKEGILVAKIIKSIEVTCDYALGGVLWPQIYPYVGIAMNWGLGAHNVYRQLSIDGGVSADEDPHYYHTRPAPGDPAYHYPPSDGWRWLHGPFWRSTSGPWTLKLVNNRATQELSRYANDEFLDCSYYDYYYCTHPWPTVHFWTTSVTYGGNGYTFILDTTIEWEDGEIRTYLWDDPSELEDWDYAISHAWYYHDAYRLWGDGEVPALVSGGQLRCVGDRTWTQYAMQSTQPRSLSVLQGAVGKPVWGYWAEDSGPLKEATLL